MQICRARFIRVHRSSSSSSGAALQAAVLYSCILVREIGSGYLLEALAVDDVEVHAARGRSILHGHVVPLHLPPVYPPPAERVVLAQLAPPPALGLRAIALDATLVVQGMFLRGRHQARSLGRESPRRRTPTTAQILRSRAVRPI